MEGTPAKTATETSRGTDGVRRSCFECALFAGFCRASSIGATHVLIGLVLLTGMLGCAPWKKSNAAFNESTSGRNPLPKQRMSPDTVVLEVMTINVPESLDENVELDWVQHLWSQLDETSLPIDLRRRLQDNGLRVGITSTQLPPQIERLIANHEKQEELESQIGHQAYQKGSSHHRWQSRMAQPKRYTLTPVQNEMTWLYDEAGYVTGQTLKMAQCQVEVTTYPEPDGKVRVDLLPLIEHGEFKQKVGVAEQAFVALTEKERKEFSALRIGAVLVAGQTLVMTQTHENAGLGHLFFGPRESEDSQKSILLIRLAQTQLNDLFSREQIFAPIETSTD